MLGHLILQPASPGISTKLGRGWGDLTQGVAKVHGGCLPWLDKKAAVIWDVKLVKGLGQLQPKGAPFTGKYFRLVSVQQEG